MPPVLNFRTGTAVRTLLNISWKLNKVEHWFKLFWFGFNSNIFSDHMWPPVTTLGSQSWHLRCVFQMYHFRLVLNRGWVQGPARKACRGSRAPGLVWEGKQFVVVLLVKPGSLGLIPSLRSEEEHFSWTYNARPFKQDEWWMVVIAMFIIEKYWKHQICRILRTVQRAKELVMEHKNTPFARSLCAPFN